MYKSKTPETQTFFLQPNESRLLCCYSTGSEVISPRQSVPQVFPSFSFLPLKPSLIRIVWKRLRELSESLIWMEMASFVGRNFYRCFTHSCWGSFFLFQIGMDHDQARRIFLHCEQVRGIYSWNNVCREFMIREGRIKIQIPNFCLVMRRIFWYGLFWNCIFWQSRFWNIRLQCTSVSQKVSRVPLILAKRFRSGKQVYE